MIDDETAGKAIVMAIGSLWWASGPIGKWWEKQHPAKKADELAAASVDIGKVLLDHDKAHLEELDNLAAEHKVELDLYEARELNLTGEKGELLRQNRENAALHSLALEELRADRDADRRELATVRSRLAGAIADATEERADCRQRLDSLYAELQAVALSFEKQKAQDAEARRALASSHERVGVRLKGEISDLKRQLYDIAKKGEKAGARFTATDVADRPFEDEA